MRALRGLSALLILAACAGCGGTAEPAPAPPSAQAAPGAVTLPPRPRDIPIDAVDPCSLLTADALERLGLEGNLRNVSSSTPLLGAADECKIFSFGTEVEPANIALAVALAPRMGIEQFTEGDLLTDVSPLAIEGFPAILAKAQRYSTICSVVLDVAPGQLVSVDYSDGGNDTPVSRDRLCDGAQQAATAVMQALIAGA